MNHDQDAIVKRMAELKIYFAASIRGGDKDKNVYREIIRFLGSLGIVLTEHIIGQFTTTMGSPGDVKDIYTQDMRWLVESDVVIAEVTQPSTGVGYEIAMAEKLEKRILCLYRPMPGKSLSAMIAGSPDLKLVNYQRVDEAKQAIKEFIGTV